MLFKDIVKKIKEVKIQGATNIALAGLKAMSLKGFSAKKLLEVRPTEPLLRNALKFAKKYGQEKAIEHIFDAQKKIINYGYKRIKPVVFTHCHSSTVINILRHAKEKGKKFKVYNTETRPLYQGRKTAKELVKYGIKVVQVVDAAAGIAMTLNHKKKHIVLFGADAILKEGDCINKVGSGMFANIAYDYKIPVYICADSWKFSSRNVKLEKRNFREVWKRLPKHIRVRNPAFEIIDNRYIKGIISELGILSPKKFVRKVKREYKWI